MGRVYTRRDACFRAAYVALGMLACIAGVSCRSRRIVKASEIIGTWVSDDFADCVFQFHEDGSASYKNVPTRYFNSSAETGDRLKAGTFWTPPFSHRSGRWSLTQPDISESHGTLRFEYPTGSGDDFSIQETDGTLNLFLILGDPDEGKALFFHKQK